VTEDGAISLDGDSVTLEELQRAVAALPEAERQKITVRADARVGYGVIVGIIDALRNAGVTGLSLPMDAVQAAGQRSPR
jgi:biopolymer transport protein ExbD